MNILTRIKTAGNIVLKGWSGVPIINSADFNLPSGTFKRTKKGDKQAYIDNFTSWVFAAVSCIARNVAKVDILLYKETSKNKRESWEQIFEHPFLDLIKKPNPWMDMYFVKYITEVFLGLVGNAYWYVPKNKVGKPGQIIPLLAHRVIPYAKNHFEVDYYEYLLGNTIIRFTPDEIIHFKEPNPNSLIVGLSPLEGILLPVDTNKAMMEYSMSLFENGAFFGTVIKVPDDMPDTDFERLKTEIKEQFTGVSKAGRTKVLRGVKEIESLVKTMADLGFEAGRKLTKEDILQSYGVPESKLGAGGTAVSSRATAYELDRTFIEQTIQPRLVRRDGVINQFLLPQWDDKLVCESEQLTALDRELAIQVEESRLRTGYWSINEARALNGDPPVPWGERPWVGMNLIQMSGYVSSNTGKNAKANKKRQMRAGFQQAKERKWKAWVKREESIERQYIVDLKNFWEIQKKIVLSNLERIFPAGKNRKELIDFVFPQINEQADKLAQVSKKHIRQAIIFGMLTALEFEGKGIKSKDGLKTEIPDDDLEDIGFTPASFEVYIDESVKKWKDTYGLTINETMRVELQVLLEQATREGWTTTQIQQEIKALYSDYTEGISPVRSLRIARTEISRIMNEAELTCYRNLGYKDKTWSSELDEVVCETCEGLDGEVVAVDEPFSEGVMSPPVHPNCRCVMLAGNWLENE